MKTQSDPNTISENLGQVDPKLYRSISLDSYDFTTLSADNMGKIYFQVFFIISNCLSTAFLKDTLSEIYRVIERIRIQR